MSQTTYNAQGIAYPNRVHAAAPSHPLGLVWRYTLRFVGQIRRQYLCRFRPDYVARMKNRRLGQCRACGSCCNLTFHCPFLTDEKRCVRYERRTLTCRHFPIDATDLKLTCVPCGHHFAPRSEEEPCANSAD